MNELPSRRPVLRLAAGSAAWAVGLVLMVLVSGSALPPSGPGSSSALPRPPGVASPGSALQASHAPGPATVLPTWTNLTGQLGESPTGREGADLAFDPASGAPVLYGGFGCEPACGYFSDTWNFTNASWQEDECPACTLAARTQAAMAYDPLTGYLLLFGGENAAGDALANTWKFEEGVWVKLNPTLQPSARWGASLVWDSTDQEMLLFGGTDGTTGDQDTWEFQDGNWTEVALTCTPATCPSARWDASMVDDPNDGQVLLFGGETSSGPVNDSWAYSGGVWSELSTPHAPSPRSAASIANDVQDGEIVLFGGLSSGGGELADTWVFVADEWYNISGEFTIFPSGRSLAPMTYDADTGDLLLFGGVNASDYLGDTWSFGELPEQVSLSASQPAADLGQTVWFNATVTGGNGNPTFRWSGLPGCTGGSGASVTCVVSSLGSTTVEVGATDAGGFEAFGDLSGFEVSSDPTVTTPVAAPATLDAGQTTALSTSASGGVVPYAYLWSGLPTGCASSSTDTLSCTPTEGGSFPVTVTVTDANRESVTSAPLDLTVAGALTLQIASSVALGGAPLPVDFSSTVTGGSAPLTPIAWHFGDGNTGTGATPTHTYDLPGAYVVTAWENDSAGAGAEATETVQAVPPLVVALTPNNGTVGGTAGASATVTGGIGYYDFAWTLNGSSLGSNASRVSFVPSGAANVTLGLTVTSGGGTQASSSTRVEVVPRLEVVALTNAISVSVGSTLTLQAYVRGGFGPYTVVWEENGANTTVTSETWSLPLGQAGSYVFQVWARDASGVVARSPSVTVTVVGSSSSSSGPFALTDTTLALLLLGLVVVAVLLVLYARRRGSGRGTSAPVPPEGPKTGPPSGDTLPSWPAGAPLSVLESRDPAKVWRVVGAAGSAPSEVLGFTSNLPAEVAKRYGLEGASLRRVARTEGEEVVAPGDADQIGYLIEKHFGAGAGRVVVLEAMDQVVDAAGLKAGKRLLALARELALSSHGRVLVLLDPESRSRVDLRQLEEGADVLGAKAPSGAPDAAGSARAPGELQ